MTYHRSDDQLASCMLFSYVSCFLLEAARSAGKSAVFVQTLHISESRNCAIPTLRSTGDAVDQSMGPFFTALGRCP
jgi:hypothetical protein